MSIEYIGALLGVIIAGGTILGYLWSAFIKPRWLKMKRNAQLLEKIYSELVSNGGKSLRDTVDRIERGQTIQQSFIRHILSDSINGAFEANNAGEYIWANAIYVDLSGRPLANLLGNDWINGVHPDDQNRVFEEWMEAVTQKREFNITYRLVCEEGQITKVKGKAVPIRDANNKVLGFVGSFRIIN